MKNSKNYHDEMNKENVLKLRRLMEELPEFCRQFFRGIEQTTSSRTRLAYAYDLGVFFEFLHRRNPALAKMEVTKFPLSVLDQVAKSDIEEYMEYLSYYQKEGNEYTNDERGKRRKLSSLRTLYNYFFKDEQIRKGGYEDVVYFGEEVEAALGAYLEQRIHIIPMEGHENAFFLSLQNRRMAVRSVENLVKKYASLVTTAKRITPHKLRSTYGTTLYQETGDIYLVADVLGHRDVNTTRKHYAAMKDENKRKAAKSVKLREP